MYDIGTEIIIFHCFATKMLKSFCKSIIFSGIESARRDLAFRIIKTWFKALWGISSKNCMRPWIRSLSNILPKRPLRDDFLGTNMTFWSKIKLFGIWKIQIVEQVQLVSDLTLPASGNHQSNFQKTWITAKNWTFACDLGFAAYQIFRPKGPCGSI